MTGSLPQPQGHNRADFFSSGWVAGEGHVTDETSLSTASLSGHCGEKSFSASATRMCGELHLVARLCLNLSVRSIPFPPERKPRPPPNFTRFFLQEK